MSFQPSLISVLSSFLWSLVNKTWGRAKRMYTCHSEQKRGWQRVGMAGMVLPPLTSVPTLSTLGPSFNSFHLHVLRPWFKQLYISCCLFHCFRVFIEASQMGTWLSRRCHFPQEFWLWAMAPSNGSVARLNRQDTVDLQLGDSLFTGTNQCKLAASHASRSEAQ